MVRVRVVSTGEEVYDQGTSLLVHAGDIVAGADEGVVEGETVPPGPGPPDLLEVGQGTMSPVPRPLLGLLPRVGRPGELGPPTLYPQPVEVGQPGEVADVET